MSRPTSAVKAYRPAFDGRANASSVWGGRGGCRGAGRAGHWKRHSGEWGAGLGRWSGSRLVDYRSARHGEVRKRRAYLLDLRGGQMKQYLDLLGEIRQTGTRKAQRAALRSDGDGQTCSASSDGRSGSI